MASIVRMGSTRRAQFRNVLAEIRTSFMRPDFSPTDVCRKLQLSPRYLQALLTEYQYAAKDKIDVEQVDPDRNYSRAKALVDKYKIVSDESQVILDYDNRNKTVKASEMAEVDQGNPMFGEPPKMTAFKGEQAITGAMIDLVEGKKNAVGYVLGHKEPDTGVVERDIWTSVGYLPQEAEAHGDETVLDVATGRVEELPRLEQQLRLAFVSAGRLDDAVASQNMKKPTV